MKTAILFGATGMVGNEVLHKLLVHPEYEKIVLLTRKRLSPTDSKVEQHVVAFDQPIDFTSYINGDDLFCCLGTTMRKAGSKEAFRKVDYDLVIEIARIAAAKAVKNFLVISSIGANPASGNFYLKTKGEMERDLQEIPLQHIKILRPSMLTGSRPENRSLEKTGIALAKAISFLMIGKLKKYKPISSTAVAKAMIALANDDSDRIIYESDILQQLGR